LLQLESLEGRRDEEGRRGEKGLQMLQTLTPPLCIVTARYARFLKRFHREEPLGLLEQNFSGSLIVPKSEGKRKQRCTV